MNALDQPKPWGRASNLRACARRLAMVAAALLGWSVWLTTAAAQAPSATAEASKSVASAHRSAAATAAAERMAPVAGQAPAPAPKAAMPNEVAVIGAYRPVDAAEPKGAPAAQAGLDLYLAATDSGVLQAGQHFDVFRRLPTPAAPEVEVTVRVGQVKIVSFHGPLAVARVVSGPDPSAQPHLSTPGVIVGDFIRADQPQKQSLADASKPNKARKRPARGNRRRNAGAKKPAKAAAEPGNAPKEPELPGPPSNTDSDSFIFWDQTPVDF